jgi:hypothetical protein
MPADGARWYAPSPLDGTAPPRIRSAGSSPLAITRGCGENEPRAERVADELDEERSTTRTTRTPRRAHAYAPLFFGVAFGKQRIESGLKNRSRESVDRVTTCLAVRPTWKSSTRSPLAAMMSRWAACAAAVRRCVRGATSRPSAAA